MSPQTLAALGMYEGLQALALINLIAMINTVWLKYCLKVP